MHIKNSLHSCVVASAILVLSVGCNTLVVALPDASSTDAVVGPEVIPVDAVTVDVSGSDRIADDGIPDRACADTRSDPANCGACGTVCAIGEACVAGRCSPPAPWARRLGTSGVDATTDVAVDARGNVSVVSHLDAQETVDIGGGPLAAVGATDLLVASYTAAGVHRWSRRMGGPNVGGASIASDPDGGVCVTGSFFGSIDFGMGPVMSRGLFDFFVACFGSTGELRWSRAFGGTDADEIGGVTVGARGDVYVVGVTRGTLTLDGGHTVRAEENRLEGFALHFDARGELVWVRSARNAVVRDVALDGAGGVYLAGYFRSTTSFGGATFRTDRGFSAFIAAYDEAGAPRWSHALEGLGSSSVESVAANANGVVIGGDFQSRIDFGGGLVTAVDDHSDGFVVSYSPSGTRLWSRTAGAPSETQVRGVFVRPDGVDVVVQFVGDLDLGGSVIHAVGAREFVVATYSTAGDLIDTLHVPGSNILQPNGVATLGRRQVYVAGMFDRTLNLPGGVLTSDGRADGFVAMFTR